MNPNPRFPILPALALLAACATTAFAQTTLNWTNTAGGVFSVPGNWSPNQVPGTNDTVVFNNVAGAPDHHQQRRLAARHGV